MPKVISIHTDQSIREWVPSPLAPRSGLRLMPAALTVPNLRTFDSTDSWSPQTKWPSTPAPEESSSQQAENTADLITSDDPWYLDAAAKLMLERVPQSISHDQPDFEVLYEFLKNCSDTRLPLELFALAINLMEVFPRNGSWMGRWMESRPEHGTVHEHDDCLPEGTRIFLYLLGLICFVITYSHVGKITRRSHSFVPGIIPPLLLPPFERNTSTTSRALRSCHFSLREQLARSIRSSIQ